MADLRNKPASGISTIRLRYEQREAHRQAEAGQHAALFELRIVDDHARIDRDCHGIAAAIRSLGL